MAKPAGKDDEAIRLGRDVDHRRRGCSRAESTGKSVKAQLATAETTRRRRKIIDAGQYPDPVEPLDRVDMGCEVAAISVGADPELPRFDFRLDEMELLQRRRVDLA